MKLLTTRQTKLDKSQTHGLDTLTVGLQLSPEREAAAVLSRTDLPSVCSFSGACAALCLRDAGLNKLPTHSVVRATRTALYFDDPDTFFAQLFRELKSAETKAYRLGYTFAIRPNVLSDLPKLAHRIAKQFPGASCYDYTKIPRPHLRQLDNYRLAYSYSERSTKRDITECIKHGVNIAVVFDAVKGSPLPKHCTLAGATLPVIDGDVSDLIYTYPTGVIIGLRFKGSRRRMQDGIDAGWIKQTQQTH